MYLRLSKTTGISCCEVRTNLYLVWLAAVQRRRVSGVITFNSPPRICPAFRTAYIPALGLRGLYIRTVKLPIFCELALDINYIPQTIICEVMQRYNDGTISAFKHFTKLDSDSESVGQTR